MANYDIEFKDGEGNKYYPRAHQDNSGNVISTTYVKGTDIYSTGTTTINGAKITNDTIPNTAIHEVDADKIKVTGKSIGTSSDKLSNIYVTTDNATTVKLGSTSITQQNVTAGGTTKSWADIFQGAPQNYIKSISISGDTLTIVKVVNGTESTETWTPTARFG